jgi:hypothetical protein
MSEDKQNIFYIIEELLSNGMLLRYQDAPYNQIIVQKCVFASTHEWEGLFFSWGFTSGVPTWTS